MRICEPEKQVSGLRASQTAKEMTALLNMMHEVSTDRVIRTKRPNEDRTTYTPGKRYHSLDGGIDEDGSRIV